MSLEPVYYPEGFNIFRYKPGRRFLSRMAGRGWCVLQVADDEHDVSSRQMRHEDGSWAMPGDVEVLYLLPE